MHDFLASTFWELIWQACVTSYAIFTISEGSQLDAFLCWREDILAQISFSTISSLFPSIFLTQNTAHRMFLLIWEGFWALFFLGSSDARILPWCLSCSEGSDWDEVVEVHRGGRCPSSPSWACSVPHMPSRDGSGKKRREQLIGDGSRGRVGDFDVSHSQVQISTQQLIRR